MAAPRRRLLGTVQELWGSDELRASRRRSLDEVRSGLVYFALDAGRGRARGSTASSRRRSPPRYPGDDVRGVPPFLTLRLVDRRRPRRQPVRHAGRDPRARSTSMREQCLRPPRAAPDAAGRAHLALGPDRRARGRARAGAGRRRGAVPRARRGGAAAATRRSPTGARSRSCASASARPPRAPRRATPTRASCSPTCAPPSRRCAPAAATSAPRGDLHDIIRQVEVFGFHFARLDIREHAGVHRAALDRDPLHARRRRGLRRRWTSPTSSTCCAR